MLTFRFYALAMGFPTLLILSQWVDFLVVIAVLYGCCLSLLVWLDWRSAGSASQWRVHRVHDAQLSLGVKNRICIQIASRAQRPLKASVRDEPPLLLSGADEALLTATIAPMQSITLEYTLRPVKRGDFAFGDINLRWWGSLNLVVRQATIHANEQVKVYPNLHEVHKYDLLARRDQLAEMGLRVRRRGEGTEFESLRDYTPDDPYRSINWKATARRGKPIATDYEPERSQRVMILLDIGRTMRSPFRVHEPDSPPWDMAKVDFVLNSVLLFSYVATVRGDQVGLLVFADQIQSYIAPMGGRKHFQKLLETMYALESQPVEPDYGKALNFLKTRLMKRSLVVVFTDLSGLRASEALLKHVPYLMPRHVPLLVTIRDHGLAAEANLVPTSSDQVYRRAVAQQMLDERRLLLEKLQRSGVLTLDVDAQHMTMAVVNRYLEMKAQAMV